MSSIGYRKDIDGLRAISILLVIFYHLKCNFASAGFLGVDIFFVISGYLITSKILKDISSNHFSFKNFYLGRIKRILPALGIVLLVVSVAVYFLFYPNDIRLYAHSLLATLCFASNLYFWRYLNQSTYFSNSSGELPLLHTWSLGIEEQFYILWPLFIYLIYRYKKERYFFKIATLCATLSFTSYLVFHQNVNFTYYSPITRAFELLLGAIATINYTYTFKSKYTTHLLSLCALAMLILPACLLDKLHFPSAYTLLPCFGAVLLIKLGEQQNSIGNQLLSNPVAVFIGLISYSLYLWHWPIIVFANYYAIPLNLENSAIIFFMSIALSTLTWMFIEKPIRFNLNISFFKTVFLITMIMWIPDSAFSLIMGHDPNLGYNTVSNKINAFLDFYGPLKKNYGCFNESNNLFLPSEKQCSVGESLPAPSVLISGDSHAMAYAGMLDVFLRNTHLRGTIFTWYEIGYKKNPQQYDRLVKKLILSGRFKYVVIARWWYAYTDHTKNATPNYQKITGQLNAILMLCEKHHIVPVIIFDIPPLLSVNKLCGLSRIKNKKCYNPVHLIEKSESKINNILIHFEKKYHNIIFINPKKIICDARYCYSSLDGNPLYFDGHKHSHLSFAGSQLIGRLYLKKYPNPFKGNLKN